MGGLLAVLLVLQPQAEGVLVFPAHAPSGIRSDHQQGVDETIKDVLHELRRHDVFIAADIQRLFGFDLERQRQSCRRDLLCRLQIAEAIGAEWVLQTEIDPLKGRMRLRFDLFSVRAARKEQQLTLETPASDEAVAAAVGVAARRLFFAPDAAVTVTLHPPDATVTVFGEALPALVSGRPHAIVSGTYFGVVQHPGYDDQRFRIAIRPGADNAFRFELQPSLIYTSRGPRDPPPLSVPPPTAVPQVGSSGRRAWAWAMLGLGIAAAGTGGALAATSQDQYNELSGEQRFALATTSGPAATDSRSSARTTFKVGSGLAIGGLSLSGAAAVWVALEYLLVEGNAP